MISVWLISILASLGGLAVFVGLCIEKSADQDGFSNISQFRRAKSLHKRGERFVRWGVFAELVLGFVVAAWDGWESYKNRPENQPIRTLTASAWFMTKGNDSGEFDIHPRRPLGEQAGMMLLGDEHELKLDLMPANLIADDFSVMHVGTNLNSQASHNEKSLTLTL